MQYQTVGSLIRKAENDYVSGKTQISKYVTFSQYENIEKIDAYLNSKHISGETDSIGREKPFFNIVTGAVNIWYRATDIDRKDIRIKATKRSDVAGAFLATIHLQEWMKKDAFGVFLNEWGRSLARYGSTVVKFVTKKDGLHANVMPWNRIICDTVDFDAAPVIEKLYFTQGQLKNNKAYDKEKVKELLNALEVREGIGQEKRDNRNEYIELYEIHGLMPLFYLTGEEDDKETYVQQMHVISFFKNEKTGEYEEFTLLKGKEAKNPYMITHLIKEDGRTQSIGAVEHLFEAQWMVNHSAKAIKDQLDLASKLIFQTADGSFVGQNALTNIENGDILIHSPNEPLTQLANSSHDITSLQSFGQQWQVLAREIVSTPESIQGKTPPSGIAYRTTALANQEAHSLFELMTENKGLAIEQMLRTYVIPYLRTKMDTSEEIAATLDAQGIEQLDSMFIRAEIARRINTHVKSHMFKQNGKGGEVAPPVDEEELAGAIKKDLMETGNQRFIRPSDITTQTWNEILEGLEWDVEVEVTNEQSDKQAVLTTLSTVLQTIGGNPAVLQDPNMKLIFNKILEVSGSMSPMEIVALPPVAPEKPQNRISQSMSYKDVPEDIKRQVEQAAGFQPSQAQPVEQKPKVGGSAK